MISRRSLLRELVVLCAIVGGLLFIRSAPALAQREHVFSFSFGSAGSGEGQLLRPGALAVNESTGDVYVIDRGNGRVEIFNSKGEYVSQFNGSVAPTGEFLFAGENEGGIAVDNSANPSDPSRGDVYVLDTGHNVIDKFTASGVYIGQVTGTSPSSPFPSGELLVAIATDAEGALWVQVGVIEGIIDQFNDSVANQYVSTATPKISNEGAHINTLGTIGLAFDSGDNFYIGLRPEAFQKFTFPAEFSKTGEALAGELDGEETTGLAVDLSSDDVYVDHETSVAAYGPLGGSAIERFGSPQMQVSEGITIDSATGTVYTANANGQEIDAFSAFVVPDVTTGSASNFTETSVTVAGVVNPDGLPITSCVFEYGTSSSYGQSAPCSPSPGSGSGPVAVSVQLKGLAPLTKYHFRLNVSNASGSNQGQDRTFVTPQPVSLSEEAVSDVSSSSALFSVQVDPGGADTTYAFEYGTSVSYGERMPVPAGELGAGTSSESVSVRVEGLLGEATYHVRVVASNVLGTVYGLDETFTTQAGGGAFVLPDDREWEMVSPPNKEGARIAAIGGEAGGLPDPIEASGDGSAISYGANAPMGANIPSNPAPFGATQVLSRRSAGGWSSEDIALPHQAAGEGNGLTYMFFSPDLSQAIVEAPGNGLLSPAATERTPYLHDDSSGSYTPLVTASNVVPGTEFGPPGANAEDVPLAVAATPDLSHVLILAQAALTDNAVKSNNQNLYEWSGGGLQLVNELPGGVVSANGAELGSDKGQDTRNALSSDGSRVFFEEGNAEIAALYMRDTVVDRTVRLDAPAPGVSPPPDGVAVFEIASVDGSEVFFLDNEPLTLESKLEPKGVGQGGPRDLYACHMVEEANEPKCDLTDLSVDENPSEVADVQDAVVGASEDGSVVYFVATGKLAGGAESGKDNLYVESKTGSSWSEPRLVAVLSEADSDDWAGEKNGQSEYLTSRVSPNGRYVAFMSDRSLTGYDNRDANSGHPDEEIFLYDEAAGRLSCVSCNPTGSRPDGILDPEGEGHELLVDGPGLWRGRWLAASIPGWTRLENSVEAGVYYQSRVLTDEGRMFFDSADALVPQDTNGGEDVYEYEPLGVGSCTRSGGCVSLISSGTSAEESAFLDASASGGDVFFLTTSRLVPRDVDTSFDVYDAHVCSAAAPCVSTTVSPPPCTSGDACKAAPSPQPAIFGAPSSATFSGAGNVTPSSPAGSAGASKKTRKSSHGKRKKPKPKPKRKRKGNGKGRGKSSRARRSLFAETRR